VSYEQPDKPYELLIEQDRAEEERQRKAEFEAERLRARREADRLVAEEESSQRRMVTRPMSSFIPGNYDWLWEDRIPMGEITALGGKAGVGKSTLLATFAAWITQGKMRGNFYGQPRNVLYIPNEDSVEKGLLPRLMAAGADLDRIFKPDIMHIDVEQPIILPEDCDRLIDTCNAHEAVAVIIDPLSSNMSDKDRNRPEVRQSYERLRRAAERANIAILGNGHIRKGGGADLLEAFMGSSEIGNVLRAALGVVVDPDSDERQYILSQCKNNYGPDDLKSYVYRIQRKEMWTEYGTIKTSCLEWQESTDRQVNDIMSETLKGETNTGECTLWLKDYLTMNGSASRKDTMSDAKKEGFAEHIVKAAARKLHVQFKYVGFPKTSVWSLPSNQAVTDMNQNSQNMAD
jgi:energy-coupling factor transporter ATP-binding protein EcfA2